MLNACCIKLCSGFIIGCVSTCAHLVIGYAVTGGMYTLKTEFNGAIKTITREFELGELLMFPLSSLASSYTFHAQVLDDSGNVMTFQHDGTCYDGFIFQTNIGVCDDNPVTNFTPCL